MNKTYERMANLLWEGSFDPEKEIESAKRREINRLAREAIKRQKKTTGAGNTREGQARTAKHIRMNPPKDLGKPKTKLSKKQRTKMGSSIAAVGAGLEIGYRASEKK